MLLLASNVIEQQQVISCPKDANSFASDFAPLKKGKRYEILLVDVLKKKDAWARNVYRSFMCVCVCVCLCLLLSLNAYFIARLYAARQAAPLNVKLSKLYSQAALPNLRHHRAPDCDRAMKAPCPCGSPTPSSHAVTAAARSNARNWTPIGFCKERIDSIKATLHISFRPSPLILIAKSMAMVTSKLLIMCCWPRYQNMSMLCSTNESAKCNFDYQ